MMPLEVKVDVRDECVLKPTVILGFEGKEKGREESRRQSIQMTASK